MQATFGVCEELMAAEVNEKVYLESSLIRFYSVDVTNQLLYLAVMASVQSGEGTARIWVI